LLVKVIDDGDGMDGHTLDHALDPFFSNKPAGRRVGMGLPRAGQLAAAHGGRVDLRSELGHGTTATLVLPLEPGGESADALTTDDPPTTQRQVA
ncbi:MAG: ATP-binding protein, partial [Planctomycetota bacterium]